MPVPWRGQAGVALADCESLKKITLAVTIPESFHKNTLKTWHLNYLNHSFASLLFEQDTKQKQWSDLAQHHYWTSDFYSEQQQQTSTCYFTYPPKLSLSSQKSVPNTAIITMEQQGHLCGTQASHPESPGQPAGHTYLVLHYSARSTLVLFVWGQADFQQGCSKDQNMQANWMHPVGRWLLLHLQLQATSEKKGYFVQVILIQNHKGHCQCPSIQKEKKKLWQN